MGRRNWISKEKRVAVYLRDGCRCVYCGSQAKLTLDHVKPKAMGGRDLLHNLVTACQPCNASKKDMSLRSWCFSRGMGPTAVDGVQRRVQRHKTRGTRDRRAFAHVMVAYGRELKSGQGAKSRISSGAFATRR